MIVWGGVFLDEQHVRTSNAGSSINSTRTLHFREAIELQIH